MTNDKKPRLDTQKSTRVPLLSSNRERLVKGWSTKTCYCQPCKKLRVHEGKEAQSINFNTFVNLFNSKIQYNNSGCLSRKLSAYCAASPPPYDCVTICFQHPVYSYLLKPCIHFFRCFK